MAAIESEPAAMAAARLEDIGRDGRGPLLSVISSELGADGEAVIAATDHESALGTHRLMAPGTLFQLRFFGDVVRDGGYHGALDPATTTTDQTSVGGTAIHRRLRPMASRPVPRAATARRVARRRHPRPTSRRKGAIK